MLTINTNVMALNAQLALSQQTQKINQLNKVMDAANSEGFGEFSIGGPAASIVPTFITSEIAGTNQAISNIIDANKLASKEKDTVSDMIDAITTMQNSANNYNTNSPNPPSRVNYQTEDEYNTAIAAFTATQAGLATDFSAAQARLTSDISSDVYNNIDLSNGGNFQFQIGPTKNEKIVLQLGRLVDQIQDLQSISIADSNANASGKYLTVFTALNSTKGSVNATISVLGFVKSRLQNDNANNIQYRKDILDNNYSKAHTEWTVQMMLQNAAQAILAQANASTDGIIELIKSARVSYA